MTIFLSSEQGQEIYISHNCIYADKSILSYTQNTPPKCNLQHARDFILLLQSCAQPMSAHTTELAGQSAVSALPLTCLTRKSLEERIQYHSRQVSGFSLFFPDTSRYLIRCCLRLWGWTMSHLSWNCLPAAIPYRLLALTLPKHRQETYPGEVWFFFFFYLTLCWEPSMWHAQTLA